MHAKMQSMSAVFSIIDLMDTHMINLEDVIFIYLLNNENQVRLSLQLKEGKTLKPKYVKNIYKDIVEK